MKDLLEYILNNMLDEGATTVSEEREDGFVKFTIQAQKDDIGKIIGKGGKTINSIKNLLKIHAIKEGIRIDVQVLEK